MKRRYILSYQGKEQMFLLLFLLLLFLSAVRVIDLLPISPPEARPAMATQNGQTEANLREIEREGSLNPTLFTPHSAPSSMGPQREERGPEPASTPMEQRPGEDKILEAWVPSQKEEETRDKPLEEESFTSVSSPDLRGPEPKVLIYHTHTTEAYTATPSSPYVQTSSYRTADASKSVLAVGEALAEHLSQEYGFAVIHDTTDHEPPSLKTAYSRSEKTMQAYLEQYPSLVLFIDIHRDASSDTSDYVMIDGLPTARLMCVVGQGTNYEIKPNFEDNYALAAALTTHLREVNGRLARDVRVKTGRYNQHVGQMNLLIEVGHNANTLEQALNAVPILAKCLAMSLEERGENAAADEKVTDLRVLLLPSIGN